MEYNIYRLKKYFLYFLTYSVIGWIYEVFLEVVVYRWGYSDRGVLFGPYCPVYGIGALIFIFLVYPVIKNKDIKRKIMYLPVVFLLCLISATVTELIASYVCEFMTGTWQWKTYADYKYNFQARIALSPSIRFGIGGVVFLYAIQPLLEKITDMMNKRTLDILFYITAVVFTVDMVCFIAGSVL